MSRHDVRISLQHMRDHAAEAIEITRTRRRADLDEDRIVQLALVRLVEIVGEAAARVGPELRATLPSIPWVEIVGMRHRLVHGYDQVDLDVLWRVIAIDLPPLVGELDRLLAQSR